MMKDVNINGLVMRKGDTFLMGVVHMCNNPNEWIEPTKFIPERFDSNSPYFLTPGGQKRNTYSFAPFTGGHRICIGMSLAMNISKVILPGILHQIKFEAIDPNFEMPYNNLFQRLSHTFNVKASPRRA